MDAESTTETVGDVINNALEGASKLGESTYVILIVLLAVLVAVLVPFVLTAWQSREDKREARTLERENKEMIAKSHEKVAEAVCKLVDNDGRSIECQLKMQHQLAIMQERGIVLETVADECLALAADHVGSESISADIDRIRKRLEVRRS